MKILAPNKLILCILVGVILCVVGYLLGGETSINLGRTGPYVVDDTPKELVLTEPLAFKKLELNTSKADILIEQGDQFRLEALHVDGSTPKYELAGDTLRYYDTGTIDQTLRFNIGYLSKSNHVTITLPRDIVLDSIDVTSSLGNVIVKEISTPSLTLHASMGDTRLMGTFEDKTNVIANNGDVILDGRFAGDTNIETGMGDLDMRGSFEGNTRVISSHGDVTLNGSSQDFIYFRTGMGDLQLVGTLQGKTEIFAGSGSVTLEGEIGGETQIEGSMGSVHVKTTLPRESYLIDAKAGFGDLRIPRTPNPPEAPNSLHIRSNMGDIIIDCSK